MKKEKKKKRKKGLKKKYKTLEIKKAIIRSKFQLRPSTFDNVLAVHTLERKILKKKNPFRDCIRRWKTTKGSTYI